MKRVGHLILLCSGSLCLWVAAEADDITRRLDQRIQASRAEFEAARQAVVARVNQQLGIDYEDLQRRFEERDRVTRQQLAIVEKIPDEKERDRARKKLQAAVATPDYLRYGEARLILENELERDHLLRAHSLQACEEILDDAIRADPLLRRFFHSPAYRNRYGVLLTRVVWDTPVGEAASTTPLDAYTVFADRTRMPFLIKVSPAAFSSLAFLRSLLIHELNHVLLEKVPPFAALEPTSLEGRTPTQPAASAYSMFFNLRYGWKPGYQYRLLHEYYSFKAQLLDDDAARAASAGDSLAPADRRSIEQLYEWALNELSDQNRAFVKAHPEPPITAYFREAFP